MQTHDRTVLNKTVLVERLRRSVLGQHYWCRGLTSLALVLLVIGIMPSAQAQYQAIVIRGAAAATPGNNQVTIGAAYIIPKSTYVVASSTNPNGPFTPAPFGGTGGGSFQSSRYGYGLSLPATNGTTTYYVVWNYSNPSPLSGGGTLSFDPPSNVIYATPYDPSSPLLPQAVQAAAGPNSIDLSWSNSSGATGYNIYRSTTSSGGFVKVGTTNTTTYNDPGLTPGSVYYYQVKVVTAAGETGGSSIVNTTPYAGAIATYAVFNDPGPWYYPVYPAPLSYFTQPVPLTRGTRQGVPFGPYLGTNTSSDLEVLYDLGAPQYLSYIALHVAGGVVVSVSGVYASNDGVNWTKQDNGSVLDPNTGDGGAAISGYYRYVAVVMVGSPYINNIALYNNTGTVYRPGDSPYN